MIWAGVVAVLWALSLAYTARMFYGLGGRDEARCYLREIERSHRKESGQAN